MTFGSYHVHLCFPYVQRPAVLTVSPNRWNRALSPRRTPAITGPTGPEALIEQLAVRQEETPMHDQNGYQAESM